MERKLSPTILADLQSLRGQFEQASARWPNLKSILLTWPVGEPDPLDKGLPSNLQPQSMPWQEALDCDDSVKQGADRAVVFKVGGHGTMFGHTDRPFRSGVNSYFYTRRQFGLVWGSDTEIQDHSESFACEERLAVLGTQAAKLASHIDVELSPEVMARRNDADQTFWVLLVHELLQPKRWEWDRESAPGYYVEELPDLFLASALVINRLIDCGTELTPKQRRAQWIYETCCDLSLSWKEIARKIEREFPAKQWRIVKDTKELKRIGNHYAAENSLTPIPVRQAGTRKRINAG